ncbi:MAG: multiheme c-type cytochrome [Burkholderiales bacterium]|nr:multiheme c-type cytochrome [Burkholderiales bacterium]
MTARYKLLVTVAVAGLLQAAVASGATPLPQYSHDKTLGVGSCASSLCHGAIVTWKDTNVLQNEYVTWSRSDKHARSYAVLLNNRSKEIAKKLALPEPAHRSGLCLDCHAHNPKPAQRGEGFQITDGVACEACHGPAGRWITTHVEPDATHAKNVARGMYPGNDDVARARLCLSCHFGNQDKFVTHKIMAAGHPRMSFELDTFTQIGPAHFRIDADWQKRKGNWDGVRAWAIGQAVAAQQMLALLQSPRGRDGLFPELVLFDCHSCHHPMADKRNKAARIGAGPGIVRLNDASLLMLRQIARRVVPGEAGAFAQQVARLHKAVATGSDALAQARAVEHLVTSMIPKIGAHRFSGEDVQGILVGLIDDGIAGQYADYQGAEQAVMAVQSVADFMGRHKLLRMQPLNPPMKRLLATVSHDEKYQPAAFEQALRDLRAGIQTEANK